MGRVSNSGGRKRGKSAELDGGAKQWNKGCGNTGSDKECSYPAGNSSEFHSTVQLLGLIKRYT